MFKLNFRAQFKTISFALTILLAGIAYLIYEILIGDEAIEATISGLLVAATMLILPSLCLYIDYLIISKSVEVTIERPSRKIILKNKKGVKYYSIDDVAKIIKVCSPSVAEKRTNWIPSSTFYFYKIIFDTESEIIITSLMATEFNIIGITNETEGKLFPFTFPTKNILNHA